MLGQIPLSGKHAADINDQALERAAVLLEKTAADFEQMAAAVRADYRRDPHGESLARGHDSKAQLMRGQASHIRALKLNMK